MNFQPILYVIGLLLLALGSLMIAPAALDWLTDDPAWELFAESAAVTLLFGGLFVFANRPEGEIELSLRETFLLTTASWVLLALFASLPFIFSTVTSSYADSLFEAISCLTTTGATVIVGLDYAPKGLLLWRALLQWVGGIGIIVMAITVLPLLRIGGMQLFRSEFSDRSEKVLPRVSQITKAIFWTYSGLTILCAFLLFWAGMNSFDAICHAFTAVSTGGGSTYDLSIAHFNSSLIESILIIFMVLGAVPLILQVRVLYGDYGALWRDGQFRIYLALFALAIPTALSFYRWGTSAESFLQTLRETYFNYISIMTTTGYVSADYDHWQTYVIVLFLGVMFIGGCTGSTAGGFKIFRLKIVYALTKVQMYKQYKTHVVRIPTYDGQEIALPIILSVVSFLTLFFISFGLLALCVSATGLDFITSVSASAACLTNTGPGFGRTVGPMSHYATIPDAAKWMLMFAMILGRLELITVLVLFRPSFWKK
jgi:trk system potassium uptake protein TrkH